VNATEIVVGVLILVSAFLSMAAGIGIVRFPDVLTRLHAATKPQVVGLAAVLLAILLQVPTWGVLTTIVWSGVVSFIAYKVADLTVGLRVSEEEEREGLDITSHGETAYHN